METGDRVGAFEVLVPLKAGGMGEIYLAEDMRSCEKVALKVLPPHFRANPMIRARFLAEAETYRRLSHPNVVRYVAAGETAETPYVALEWIRGQDLAQLIGDLGSIPLDMALGVMLDICYALGFAHSRGIIHRDIKPQNVMLTADNVIKLIDFGVARNEDSDVMTSAGTVLGSLCYNSPEQNQGRPVDIRSDIYSLGLLFYELLTGVRALPQRTLGEILLAQVDLAARLPAPAPGGEEAPPALVELIRRMLSYGREDRPADLSEVLTTLQALQGGDLSDLGEAALAARRVAERDRADTHFYTAMNAMAEERWGDAVAEFGSLLNLACFERSQYRPQVEEQLRFLCWRLEAPAPDPTNSPEALKALAGMDGQDLSGLEVDVLQKLHQIYRVKPHEGIREAMSNLLSFYKERLRLGPRGDPGATSATRLAPEAYCAVALELARLFETLGDREHQRVVERKLVAALDLERDPARARRRWDEARRARRGSEGVLRGAAAFFERAGDPRMARACRLRVARLLARRDEHDAAVAALREAAPADDPRYPRWVAAFDARREAAARRGEDLIRLLAAVDTEADAAAARRRCREYLAAHPGALMVLDRLQALQRDDPPARAASLVAMGAALRDRGERAAARERLAEALRLDPSNPEAMGQLVDAMRDEDPSLCDRPSLREIQREVFIRLGLADAAARDLEARREVRPDDPDLLGRLEEVYRRCREPDRAAPMGAALVRGALDAGDLELARTRADRFLGRYPGWRELLRPLASHPRCRDDAALLATLLACAPTAPGGAPGAHAAAPDRG